MTIRNTIAAVLLASLFFAACKKENKDLEALNKDRKEFWKKDTAGKDPNKALLLDNQYKKYVIDHPDDTINAELFYEDARLNYAYLDNPDQAIVQYKKVFTLYPKHRRAPEALFTTGFIYDNELQNIQLARESYSLLIKNYPDTKFASDAKVLLGLLGKDLNQVFKNRDTTAAK